jgi:hypothetical protein
MKQVILSIGFMLCSVLGMQAQVEGTTTTPSINPNAPKFKFATETLDYGNIPYDADGNREFKFTNTGKEPLIITDAKGSCGCTTPKWPKEPIMPGATGVIQVHYDTKRPGSFTKTVTLTSNADTSSKVLTIKGVVGPKPVEEVPAAVPAPAVK